MKSITVFGTKIAVRKDAKIQHVVDENLKDITPLASLMNEEVQCFYVEDNELLIDLDKEA